MSYRITINILILYIIEQYKEIYLSMKCPFCGNSETKVINSRFSSNGLSVRRRRICSSCQKRFTTYEKIEDFSINVVKKNGIKEAFDESKIMKGLMIATEKRNLSNEIIENIVSRIQKEVEESGRTEVSSKEIGLFVMDELKKIDAVGYIRFASVYKNFNDLKSFLDEIDRIKETN